MSSVSPWFHTIAQWRPMDLVYGWSDNRGPDFKTEVASPVHQKAVEELCQEAGLQKGSWAQQVHGGRVLQIGGPDGIEAGQLAGEADGLWTDQPGQGVIGRSADCPLILLGGTDASGRRAVGMAHASWRSTVKGITATLAHQLTQWGLQPETGHAVICPSAGPCCYEVGEEVRQQAHKALGDRALTFFHREEGRLMMDLWAANSDQLVQAGWEPANIHWSNCCTICGAPAGEKIYPSYRRQSHAAGRFAAVIGIKA